MMFKTLAKQKFSSKVVRISYKDLDSIAKTKNYSSLQKEIVDAYGPSGLGALIIQDVPNHYENKYKLLSLSKTITELSPEILSTIERPDINYGLGWSHGKEKFEGKPDTKKGSFYATLNVHNELTGKNSIKSKDVNIWPTKYLPELEPAFHNLGNQIREVSFTLYRCIDEYIRSIFPTYNLDYTEIIKASDHNTGRLLHYFPRGNDKIDPDEKWCGWHNDHGSYTGLCSALYFDKKGNVVNDQLKLEKTGLWAQNRLGEYVKVTYGKNDLAFQIGESYQIQSGGKLIATPHAVIIDEDIPKDVHRSTFALFMEPSFNVKLDLPKGSNIEDIKTASLYTVPKLQERYTKSGMTFGEFNDATMNAFANSGTSVYTIDH